MRPRVRGRVRSTPDLTSLLDVLFIVVFLALIRAAAAQHAAAQAALPPPRPVVVEPPPPPPEIAALRIQALANLRSDLDDRTPLVVRVSATGTIDALELDTRKIELDVPLLEHSPDPDIAVSYLGDRSAELRVCRIAVLHLEIPDLSRHLVIVAPSRPLADLPHALFEGLHRDVGRCLAEQQGLAAIVDPAALTTPTTPEPPP